MTKLIKNLRVKREGQADLVLKKGLEVTSSVVGKKEVLAYVENGTPKQVVVAKRGKYSNLVESDSPKWATDHKAKMTKSLKSLKKHVRSFVNSAKELKALEKAVNKHNIAWIKLNVDWIDKNEDGEAKDQTKAAAKLGNSLQKAVNALVSSAKTKASTSMGKAFSPMLDKYLSFAVDDNFEERDSNGHWNDLADITLIIKAIESGELKKAGRLSDLDTTVMEDLPSKWFKYINKEGLV